MIEFFPEKNIIAQIGPITLYFYGAMYALGAISGIFITEWFAKMRKINISRDDILDIIFWGMVGGVIGGRFFAVFVYNFDYYSENLDQILAVWNGGMSIHGGFLGGAIGFVLICKKKKFSLGEISSIFMPAVAIGLIMGRLGNFMNSELPGRITDASWGMDFGDGENRHPSQLYAMAKDFLLFLIISYFVLSKNFSHWKHGEVLLIFISTYSVLRFTVEFFREPDSQLGYFFGWMSMGQILSVTLICIASVFWKVRKKIF